MKAYIMQPPYSADIARAEALFQWKMQALEECGADLDLIVLPEYSDVPCVTATREETFALHETYFAPLMEKCRETARRCGATVFVNALSEVEGAYRNTTFAIDRTGEIVWQYYKRHLPPLERETLALDETYIEHFAAPDVLELDGVRYGFLTCYDFYFYEGFAAIARQNVDVLIGCSLQRSDSHAAIETMCRFLAYNTNAYVLRSSVSFAEDAEICGASMAVSPHGAVLANLHGKFGAATVEFDPHEKYYKPAGFGGAPKAHYEYIEYGRRPWLYRPAGSAIIRTERDLPYPRVCAHRGFSTVAPENSMPAFGAAVAMGADEIELDIWPTADGELVSCHDAVLSRVSNGEGRVVEHTLAELETLDFGVKFGERFAGLRIVRLEEVLEKFSAHVILNLHVKPLSYSEPYPEEIIHKIVETLRRYDCEKHVYFMLETNQQIEQFSRIAPDIPICVGHLDACPWEIVERAIRYGCAKVQLFKPYFNEEMIARAHAHGIRCNVFYSDDAAETERFLAMGIDTILTNDYNRIAQIVRGR